MVGERATLAGTTTLAGSVIALDSAVRNLVASGVDLPAAVAAASTNPLAMLGVSDRGRIAVGQRADLVELDEGLRVRRVMRAGAWFDARPADVARGGRLEVRPFTDDVIDDAARLLAARHRAQRLIEPGLPAAFEEEAATRAEIEALAARDGASGAVAFRGGSVVGYLVGAPRAALWGPNTWVEGAGHAVTEPEVARDLYGFAAAGWVEEGATSHYAVVPATDPALVDAWFRLGFGQQHVHAIREPAGPDEVLRPPPGVTVRRAERRDISALGRLDVALPEHQARSPVFSMLELPTPRERNERVGGRLRRPEIHDVRRGARRARGRVRRSGARSKCRRSTRASPSHRAPGSSASRPCSRRRAASARAEHWAKAVLLWARDAGHPTVVTDWRETNLLSSRTWPRLGFRPTFRRLHRAIA